MTPEPAAHRAADDAALDLHRLQDVLARELDRRRADVIAVDPRLGWSADLLVDFVAGGGKRLRPEFLWCGWTAAGGRPDSEEILLVGAALELIQACALVHDDIIDRSQTRRGRPATHRAAASWHADSGLSGDADHFGVSAAVLLGDLALAWADDLFMAAAAGLAAADRALPVWRAMRTEVLAGQLLDLVTSASITTDPAEQAADAMRVNRFKTAAYTVERPLHLGAALAGGSRETVLTLRSYGADIGVAFQLRDDLLGVFGDPAVTGKPAGDDLVEGKRTVLLAGARAALAGQPALLAELDAGVGSPDADVARLTAITAGTGAAEQAEQQIAALVASAMTSIDATDDTGRPAVAAPARQRLAALALAATARVR